MITLPDTSTCSNELCEEWWHHLMDIKAISGEESLEVVHNRFIRFCLARDTNWHDCYAYIMNNNLDITKAIGL